MIINLDFDFLELYLMQSNSDFVLCSMSISDMCINIQMSKQKKVIV